MKCQDYDGYYYSISLSNILDKRINKFEIVSKSNPYTIFNIQNFINTSNKNLKLISNFYKNENEKLLLKCECGNEFYQSWNYIKNNNTITCKQCSMKKRSNLYFKKDYNIVIQTLSNLGYKLIEDYDSLHSICVEDLDGYKFKTNYYNLINKNIKLRKYGKLNPFSIYNLKKYISINKIPLKLVNETERIIDSDTKIECYCSQCNDIFSITINDIISKKRYRCPCCTKKYQISSMKLKHILNLKI